MSVSRRTSREHERLSAVIESRQSLLYSDGSDSTTDRPEHVRAASAMAWIGGAERRPRLVIAQDDASFFAVLDQAHSRVDALPLDHVDGGMRQFDTKRGNKMRKLDLEACCVIRMGSREMLVAWGSGSHPARERIVILETGIDSPRIVDASPLYAALRACTDFSGSELNIEGAATVCGDRVRLFQRGNGAPRDGLVPVNATVDICAEALISWIDDPRKCLPAFEAVVQWDLGAIHGVRLSFTDACAFDGGVAYLAAAEASPNSIDDGEVVGVAFGWIPMEGDASWTKIVEADGSPFGGKAEGLAWMPSERGDALSW
jgi:hypothetical protein